MRYLVFALALFAAASPVSAQDEDGLSEEMMEIFERGCGDDRGRDRCAEETHEAMRGYYGLESAEALADRRVQVYRAMIVDGYGNDVVAISFVREPGEAPYVDVRAPSQNPAEEQPLRSPVSSDLWGRIQSLSSNFDQLLAHEMREDGDAVSMCLHGWFTVAEVVSAQSPYVSTTIGFDDDGNRTEQTEIARPEGRVRRDAEGACANGLAIPFAFDLADQAMRALPECSNLDLDDFRSAATLLALCHRLRGDRLAAAEAYQVVKALERRSWDEDENLSRHFVSLDDAEAERFEAAIEGAFVAYGMPNASTPTDATSEGWLFYFDDEETGMPSEQAELTLQLYRYVSDRFSILSWEISERLPFDPEAFE